MPWQWDHRQDSSLRLTRLSRCSLPDDSRKAHLREAKGDREAKGGVHGAESTLTALLVRRAADTGREITWDALVASREKWDAHIDLRQFD